MSPFEHEVLGRVADDYEAVHTIRSDIERDLERTVSPAELGGALVRLVEAGFVEAYSYDAQGRAYRKVGVGSAPTDELWFLISSAGRAEYDRSVA